MKTASILALLCWFSTLFSPIAAQGQVSITDMAVFYTFGDQITFQARIESNETIQTVYLALQPTGEAPRLTSIAFSQNEIIVQRPAAEIGIRPFSEVTYWYQVVTTAGNEFLSPTSTFQYDDNRIQWQILQTDTFLIHWQEGDAAFGQKLLNASNLGLKKAQDILPVVPQIPLRIFVYPSASQLQNVLTISRESWIAGHASPDLGVLLVSISPGPDASYEMERQIPHEIAHILIYQQAGTGYNNLPIWLNEGLASQAELYPNPDYRRALNRATSENSLLAFSAICQSFPRDTSGAFLAYAQSASFVGFLHQKFGSSGLQRLMAEYQDGKDCETGIQSAFGVSLTQLQTRWEQETLGNDPGALFWQHIRPFAILGLLTLLPPLLIALFGRRRTI